MNHVNIMGKITKKRLLIIGYTWPEPNTTAAGRRMLELIRCFQDQQYFITFASTGTKSEHSIDLTKLGIKEQKIVLNDSGFNAFVKTLDPNVVVFDRFVTEEQFGWRVAEFAPKALRILDTEDLHSLRHVREQLFKKNIPFTTDKWLQSDVTKREIAAIYRCDLSLIISTYEMELLKQGVNIDKKLLLHLPFQCDRIGDDRISDWPDFNSRKDFICIGNGKHSPNVDAVLWLHKVIWPLIRRTLPQANLHVYGGYLPQQLLQLHNPAIGFNIIGWTESVGTVMEHHRVNLAPLRFGAGLKGKLIDAMVYGTPSITTSIGAEGMHGELDWCGGLADDAVTFAQAATDLYIDKSQWINAQQKGAQILNAYYDREVVALKFRTTLTTLLNNLENHRKSNFLGALLRHQTLNSTKYMSKWIEAKHTK